MPHASEHRSMFRLYYEIAGKTAFAILISSGYRTLSLSKIHLNYFSHRLRPYSKIYWAEDFFGKSRNRSAHLAILITAGEIPE